MRNMGIILYVLHIYFEFILNKWFKDKMHELEMEARRFKKKMLYNLLKVLNTSCIAYYII
jgi:tRNA(Ile)-lysidine synthase TilS/MesJ